MRPSCISATRWHRSASSRYGVATITLTPSRRKSKTISQKSRRDTGSTPVVGSSSSSSSGSCTKVVASASFFCIPPESRPARRATNGSSRLKRSSRAMRSRRRPGSTKRRSAKNSRFSATDRLA